MFRLPFENPNAPSSKKYQNIPANSFSTFAVVCKLVLAWAEKRCEFENITCCNVGGISWVSSLLSISLAGQIDVSPMRVSWSIFLPRLLFHMEHLVGSAEEQPADFRD